MHRSHTQSPSFRLTSPLPSRRCLWKHNGTVQFGVLTEMIACMFQAWPPVRLLHMLSHRGATHPARLTQRVRQQITHLAVWRSTFSVADFLRQRPMLSIKELSKVYQCMCDPYNVCLRRVPQQPLALQANAGLTPWLKRGGCASGLLMGAIHACLRVCVCQPLIVACLFCSVKR